jgi:hypothetical protein
MGIWMLEFYRSSRCSTRSSISRVGCQECWARTRKQYILEPALKSTERAFQRRRTEYSWRAGWILQFFSLILRSSADTVHPIYTTQHNRMGQSAPLQKSALRRIEKLESHRKELREMLLQYLHKIAAARGRVKFLLNSRKRKRCKKISLD